MVGFILHHMKCFNLFLIVVILSKVNNTFLIDNCFIIISLFLGNVCFSRKLYEEVGGYDESVGMAEDLDLYVRFLINGHLNIYLPIISHLHRMHTANFSIGCDRDKHHSDLKDIYARNEVKLKIMGIKLTLSN